jgi:hypothetical protein
MRLGTLSLIDATSTSQLVASFNQCRLNGFAATKVPRALLAMKQTLFAQNIDGLAHRDPRHLEFLLKLHEVDIFWPGRHCFASIRCRMTEATWM